MPKVANDLLQPGSERLVEVVGDQAVADIVRDLRSGPAALPPAHPQPYPAGSGWVEQKKLGVPDGTRYVDRLCEHFAGQDRAALVRAEIERLQGIVAARLATEAGLRAEVERLQAELKKAGIKV